MANNLEGSRILREFKVSRLLGKGGFGVVLEVQHLYDRKKYAVKLAGEVKKQTIREVENLGKLPAHDNVVFYLTSWEDVLHDDELDILQRRFSRSAEEPLLPRGIHQFLCIQMELCGQDLRHWLRKQSSVDRRKCQHLFVQLLTGLQHIHDNNLIHRDLKPDNIFFSLNDDTRVKIGDFGISARHEVTVGVQHSCVGTQLYMAPEQLSSTYGKKADLYPMGLILYELFYPPAQTNLKHSLTSLCFLKKLPREFVQWPVVARSIVALLDFEPDRRPTIDKLIAAMSDGEVAPRACSSAAVHQHVTCDRCATSNIVGVRYKCSVCPNFDLCESCESKPGSHPRSHAMLKMQVPKRYALKTPRQEIDWLLEAMNEAMRLDDVDDVTTVHSGIRCDGCKMDPLKGVRYYCKDCVDFDYCQKCFDSNVEHQLNRNFIKLETHKKLNFRCDGCNKNPITGIRYRCNKCDHFDFCVNCYRHSSQHRKTHKFSIFH